MVDDDNPAEDDLESEAGNAVFGDQLGARRSTWTPPPSSGASDTSDDDLARALEEDFERIAHTGAIHTVHSEERNSAQETVDPDEPVDANPIPPPVRRSMPTTELAASLAQRAERGEDPAAIMSQLEEQLRLREADAQEFERWQQSMADSGAPDTSAAVQSAREELHDILDSSRAAGMGDSAAGSDFDSVESTHVFRMDDVHDDALLSAPAPMTAPVSDIPPPPGHSITARPAEPAAPAAPPASEAPPAPAPVPPPPPPVAPMIPDLVEPAEVRPTVDAFDFDSIIGGASEAADEEPQAFAIHDEVVDHNPDSVLDDDIADTDRAFADVFGPFPVTSEGIAILPEAPIAPAEPLASSNVNVPDSPGAAPNPVSPSAFRVEEVSTEPTKLEQRAGRASRLFWLWFAANSSVVSVAFGGAVFALGMSLRQAIVATLIGVAVSFLPLGLGTLAGKWSGQPTMIVSRATFGHLGNVLPSLLAVIVRVFWGAVLLWFLAAGTARILAGADLTGPLSEMQVTIIGLALGFLVALVMAYFGYGLIARVHLVFTIVSALLIVGLILITWHAVDFAAALTVGDGPWILVVTGAVLVFSFVGLVWAVSSADLARYQRPTGSGASSMLWSTFGSTIPAFVLITYGAILAASNPDVARGLLDAPLDTIALLIPVWYPIPLIAALGLGLVAGVVVSIYSGGFALHAVGLRMRRPAATLISGALLAVVAVLLTLSLSTFVEVLRDVATSLAVPIAAWAGIFGSEMMIRSKRFDSESLVRPGGAYPSVRWVNLAMLVVASAVGFGLTTATVGWLSWQGYLFSLSGIPRTSDLAGSDLGVFVALAVGILTPIVAGIPAIRRQEEPRVTRTASTAE